MLTCTYGCLDGCIYQSVDRQRAIRVCRAAPDDLSERTLPVSDRLHLSAGNQAATESAGRSS